MYMSEYMQEENDSQLEEGFTRSPLWKILYAIGVILLILILLSNLTGLSHWFLIGRLSLQNLTGATEVEIIQRLGEPDFRSEVQPFISGEGFGMVPQRLDEGDDFYFLNYVIGPRMYVFHFVSPETYLKHTGQIVLGEDWVVLEYYSGDRYVIY